MERPSFKDRLRKNALIVLERNLNAFDQAV